MAFSAARRVSANNSSRFRARTAASTCVLSVRWRPHALSSPASWVQHAGEQALGSTSGQQPGAELAKHSVVEAGIGQVQGQQILPVDPSSDRLSGLAVAQALAKLQERDQGQAPGRVPGLTAPRVKISKAGIVEHGAEAVTQQGVGVAAGERGAGDAGGVVGYGWDWLRQAKRHGRPLDKKTIQRHGPPQGCRFRQRCPIVYAHLKTPCPKIMKTDFWTR